MKPQARAPAPPAPVSRSLGGPAKKPVNEEVDMEALMMQELLNRSAEQPKEEKKVEEPKVEKVEEKQAEKVSEEKPEEVVEKKEEVSE